MNAVNMAMKRKKGQIRILSANAPETIDAVVAGNVLKWKLGD